MILLRSTSLRSNYSRISRLLINTVESSHINEINQVNDLLLKGSTELSYDRNDAIICDSVRSMSSATIIKHASYNISCDRALRYLNHCHPDVGDLQRLLVTLLDCGYMHGASRVSMKLLTLYPAQALSCSNLHNIIKSAAYTNSWSMLHIWLKEHDLRLFLNKSDNLKLPVLEVNSHILDALIAGGNTEKLIKNIKISFSQKHHSRVPIYSETLQRALKYLQQVQRHDAVKMIINMISDLAFKHITEVDKDKNMDKKSSRSFNNLFLLISVITESAYKDQLLKAIDTYLSSRFFTIESLSTTRKIHIERIFIGLTAQSIPLKAEIGLSLYSRLKNLHKNDASLYMTAKSFRSCFVCAMLAGDNNWIQTLLTDFESCYENYQWRIANKADEYDDMYGTVLHALRKLDGKLVSTEDVRFRMQRQGIRGGKSTVSGLVYFALNGGGPVSDAAEEQFSYRSTHGAEGGAVDDSAVDNDKTSFEYSLQSTLPFKSLSESSYKKVRNISENVLTDGLLDEAYRPSPGPTPRDAAVLAQSHGGAKEDEDEKNLTKFPLSRMKWLVQAIDRWHDVIPVDLFGKECIHWMGLKWTGNIFPEDLDAPTSESVPLSDAPLVMVELMRQAKQVQLTSYISILSSSQLIPFSINASLDMKKRVYIPKNMRSTSKFPVALSHAVSKNKPVLFPKVCLERAMYVSACHQEWSNIEDIFEVYLRSGYSPSRQAINLICVALARTTRPEKALHLLQAMYRLDVHGVPDTFRLVCILLAAKRDVGRAEAAYELLNKSHPGIVVSNVFRYPGDCLVKHRAMWLIDGGSEYFDVLEKHLHWAVKSLRENEESRERLRDTFEVAVSHLAVASGVRLSRRVKDILIDTAIQQDRSVRAAALIKEFTLMDTEESGHAHEQATYHQLNDRDRNRAKTNMDMDRDMVLGHTTTQAMGVHGDVHASASAHTGVGALSGSNNTTSRDGDGYDKKQTFEWSP